MHNVKTAYIVILFLATSTYLNLSEGGFACLSNPCVHGVCLDDLNTTYSCYCIDGYTGIQCQTNWDECWSSPCQNGGVCQDGIASFNCTCASGFAGDLCEENLNECMSNPCHNNATCLDAANGYTCNCPPGYAGVHCELDIAVCNLTNETRCSNGGMCIEGPGFTFKCRCSEGWTGLLCELEVDECMSHPCQNGAVCVDLHADYECACPFGYAGRNCEEAVLICEDNPCKNDALCLMEDEKPVCYCVPDYHGERCQFQYDECKLSNNRCLNGGSCIDGVDGFTCSCPPKLTGVYCECQIVEIRGSTYLDCTSQTPTMPTTNITLTTNMITFTPTTFTSTSTSTPTSTETLTTLSTPTSETTITTTLTSISTTEATTISTTEETTSTTTETSTTLTTPTTIVPNINQTSTEIDESTSPTEFPSTTTTEMSTITTILTEIPSPNTTIEDTTITMTQPSSSTTEVITFTSPETTTEDLTSTTIPTTVPDGDNITKEAITTENTITSTDTTLHTADTSLSSLSTESSTVTDIIIDTSSSSTSNNGTTLTSTTVSIITDTTTSITTTDIETDTTSEVISSTEPIKTTDSTTLSTTESESTEVTFSITSTDTHQPPITLITSTTEGVIDSTTVTTDIDVKTNTTISIDITDVSETTEFPLVTDFTTPTSSTTITSKPITLITDTTSDSTTELTTEITTDPIPSKFDCSKLDQSCLNGGTCIYADGFHCACVYDYAGERCELVLGIKNAAFNGHSYILHKMHTRSQMEVEFTARTSWESGVLFYANIHETYMALYMEQAHLKFKFSCGYQTMLLSELNKAVNNGNEMRISALLTFSEDHQHCNASIKLNNTITMSGAQIANFNNLFRQTSTLYLGGLSDKTNSMFKLPGFIGCMLDLIISGRQVRIFKDAEDAFGVSECSSLACLSNPCKNGGSCTALPGNSLDKFVCKCTNGYVGKQCDKSVCDNNPCKFGGTCLPFTGSGYLCLCPFGKHGHFCENDLKISKAYYSSSVQGYASFTSHPIPQTSYKSTYIKFKITPSHLNQISLLMFMGQDGNHDFHSHHMAVSFVKGFIMLTWNLGSGPRRIFTSKPIPADKANYEIQLGRHGRRAWLYVEHIGNVTGRSQGTLTRMEVEPLVYFGGYRSKGFEGLPHDLPLHGGFAGCMFDMEFKVGDVSISLESDKVRGRAVGQCGTTECYEGVCQNRGACLYHGGTFTCMCQDEFYGPLCSNKYNLCDRSSCAPSASCVPKIAGYECDCPLRRKGKYCQENETLSDISFTGTRSYLLLAPRTFEANKFNFDLELRPIKDGLVAFVGNHDYFFSITLLSGLLELRILPSKQRTQQQKLIILRSNKLLRLGMWHQIKVQVYGRKIYLFVDNIVNTAIMQPHDSLDLSHENIYLGGHPDLSQIPQAATCEFPISYKGCIRKLFIDTIHIALNEKTILRAQNIEDCDGTPCGGDYCTNGGTCWLDPNLRPHCNCPVPYYGDKCQNIYDCLEHKCKNEGYCLEGRCVCKVGYVGTLCETGLTIRSPKFVGKSYLYVNASSYASPVEISSNLGNVSGKKRNSLSDLQQYNVSIQFVTASDGLLLFAHTLNRNYFALGLQNGKLTLVNSKEQDDETKMEILNMNTLTDGLEHTLVIKFGPFRIYVDDKNYDVKNFSYVEFDQFFLGGVPSNFSWRDENITAPFEGLMFDGCIHTLSTSNMNSVSNKVDFNSYKGENIDECSI